MTHYDPVRFDSDQKDLLISQLKAEIFELRQNAKDYDALHRELLNLEHRYALLQEEKNRLQEDYHSRNEINAKSISNFRQDIESLQAKLADKNVYVRDLNSELNACRDMLDRRSAELSHVKAEYATKSDVNLKLHEDVKNLESEIDLLRSSKRSNQIEIDRLLGLNDNLNKDFAEATKRLQDAEYELNRSNNRNQELNYMLEQRNSELHDKETRIVKLDDQTMRDHDTIVKLQSEVKDLESLVDRHRKEVSDYRVMYEESSRKNQDLLSRNSDTEAHLREKEYRIVELRKDLDAARNHTTTIIEEKTLIIEELEALKEHIAILEAQNRELNDELSDFVATSEQVRARLDRKRQVDSLKAKNEEILHRSLINLSPYKSTKTVTTLKKSCRY